MDLDNPFSRNFISYEAKIKKRPQIPDEFIKAVQAECYEVDDDLRWLLAFIVDTGMRLAEAIGLKTEDIKLDAEVPSVKVSPHP